MFRRRVDEGRVRAAIEAAEATTSGQIVVSIAPWFWGSVERAAGRAFQKLGIDRTRHHNGVLLFVVPARRRFVLRGDDALHSAVGQAFWDATVTAIAEKFRAGDLTAGLVHGVELVGAELAKHFPHEPGDTNELPDVVS